MKKVLWRIGALLFLAVSIYLITTVLRFKSPHGIDQKDGLYWQPKNSIDLVLLGSSHIHCGANTTVLWEHYGIPAYDYSSAEQPLWMTYYYLQEFLKYQDPEIVFLDLYSPACFKADYQYDFIDENIHGMKFSVRKLKMIRESVEPEKIKEVFPSFAVYHGRYKDVAKADFNHFFWNRKEREAFKGFTPYWNRHAQPRPDANQIQAVQPGGLTWKSEEYLRKIIDLTKEEGVELILGVVPYVETVEERATYLEIQKIANEQGIMFINFNDHYDQIGLDFETDFNDHSHLNYWGSAKFSNYLGYYLVNEKGLTSKKGQEKYESWDRHVDVIAQELMQQSGN